MDGKQLQLYFHIPFCVQKCLYCDFLSAPADETRYEVGKDAIGALPDTYGNLILFEKSKAYYLVRSSS